MKRLVAAVLLFASATASAQKQSDAPGLLCAYKLVLSVNSWSENCAPERETELAELGTVLGTIRDDVSRHETWTDERLDDFEAEYRGAVSLASCNNQEVAFYAGIVLVRLDKLRLEIEPLLNQPTPPEWGDCQ